MKKPSFRRFDCALYYAIIIMDSKADKQGLFALSKQHVGREGKTNISVYFGSIKLDKAYQNIFTVSADGKPSMLSLAPSLHTRSFQKFKNEIFETSNFPRFAVFGSISA